MIKKVATILGVLSLLFPMVLQAQMSKNLQEEIDKIIHHETKINRDNTPGMIIGVIFRDSTFIFPYGSVTKDSFEQPDQHTLFEIGGLTKGFTAVLVQSLVADNLMHLDSSLNFYLPDSVQNPQFKASIHNLLFHTAGLPKFPSEFGTYEETPDNPYAHYTKAHLAEFYKNYEPLPSNGKYRYSNVGYALLELAIEQATGRPFEQVMQERIFHPLHLGETTFTIKPEGQARFAQGYNVAGMPVDPWQFSSFNASEGLKSTLHDLLLYLQANMLLHSSQLDELWTKQWERQLPTDLNRDTYIGLGWHVIRQKKYGNIILHPGSSSGHRVYAGFVPESKTGVVVLTNSEYGIGGLGYLILRMINFNWKKKKR